LALKEGEEAQVGAGDRTRPARVPWSGSTEEQEQFETDVLAGFVLTWASAGLANGTISGDVGHLDQVRLGPADRCERWSPTDADGYFGKSFLITSARDSNT
jgi:hypothetical protein